MTRTSCEFRTSNMHIGLDPITPKGNLKREWYDFLSIFCSYFDVNKLDMDEAKHYLIEIAKNYQVLFPSVEFELVIMATVRFVCKYFSYCENERLYDLDMFLKNLYGNDEILVNGVSMPQWKNKYQTLCWVESQLEVIFQITE